MVQNKNKILFKTILLLYCNLVYTQEIFNNSENDIAIASPVDTSSEIINECLTISDCSEGALECKKENESDNAYHCIYPENICTNPVSYVPANNTLDDLLTITNDTNNTITLNNTISITNCTTNEDCLSNKCISGQCQIDLDTTVVNGTLSNDILINQNTTIPLSCTKNEDCLSNICISGQCQVEVDVTNKLNGQKCEMDSECVSSYCNKDKHICELNKDDKYNNTVPPFVTITIGCTGFIVALVLILLIIKKNNNEKAKKIKEQYFENVQQPMYVIYSSESKSNIPTYVY